jgi:hypothetical protein
LRRLAVCSKAEADKLKADPRLDQVIANPIQTQPKGKIFGGRFGIYFKNHIGDILVSIMSQNIDKGIIDEVGTDYSEESDTE